MAATRLAILVVTYLLIAVSGAEGFRLTRPAVSLLGAVAMVTIGGLPLREAYAAIDLDVILFLLGVLLLTAYLEIAGFFEWVAAAVVRRAHSPRALLALVVLVSGVLSAFFVNDTICLVLTPLIIAVGRSLGLPPLPYLLAIALGSNVGSAMTPTGNPQNMLIGVASGIGFARFTASLAPASLGGLAIVYAVLAVVHRRALAFPLSAPGASPVSAADDAARRDDASARDSATAPAEDAPALDRSLVVRALVAFGGALAGWLAGLSLPLVAIASAALLIVIAGRDSERAMARVEWELLLFFGALFVVMRGVRDVPLVVDLSAAASARLGGGGVHDAGVVSVAMLALSNLVSNVPAVILWLPVVPKLANAAFIWLVMAMSSTFAGNLTLVGSMANLIVAERARTRGVPVGFVAYLSVGVPVTILTMLWGAATLLLVASRR